MYPYLLGQKDFFHLTDEEMGKIIGVSRAAFIKKLTSGKFYPGECQAYCKYFNKPFHYLFATEEEFYCNQHESFQEFKGGIILRPKLISF